MPELLYILVELPNMCVKDYCFHNCWKVCGKKTTATLVFFLWLVKSLTHLLIIGFLIISILMISSIVLGLLHQLQIFSHFSDRIAWNFMNRSGATPAITLDIFPTFDRVWHLKTLKLYVPFSWIGLNCLKATEPPLGDFLPLCPQRFLVLTWSTSKSWKAELSQEPSSLLHKLKFNEVSGRVCNLISFFLSHWQLQVVLKRKFL